ncbi:DUF4138 domain-containing protein [candidate division KSB1 bacterium]|nr:DUF4138 domain-containing protein [candidate division KSB1 bacterium]
MNKKRIYSWCLIALLVSSSLLRAQEQQLVRVAPGFATVIACPAPPELVTVGNIDAFSIQTAGNYILVKPLISKGLTNMFIKTKIASFNILLKITTVPDLEVKLHVPGERLDNTPGRKPASGSKGDSGQSDLNSNILSYQLLANLNPQTISQITELLKTPQTYAYSTTDSRVVFGIDHMKQINNKLFIIGTIINNSNIPYDIGFVKFSLISYARNYMFWKKKIKESEMEPVSEFYNSSIKAHSHGRILFVFDKHGFTNISTLEIKCNEENGRRNLVLEIPGTYIQ